MEIATHKNTDKELCGRPLELREGYCRVELLTTKNMTVDESGLVHGGFIFGLADYAAMLAVNHPNVVLGSSDVKFLKPVKLGDSVTAEARVTEIKGKKHKVDVLVKKEDVKVFEGLFICFILDKHVLDE
ncbi:PaaI family thioesterase [Candidatus Magnetomoraceae bacterium gMMP-1]